MEITGTREPGGIRFSPNQPMKLKNLEANGVDYLPVWNVAS